MDDVNEFNPFKVVSLPPPFDQQSCCEAVEVHVTVKEQGENGTTIGEKSQKFLKYELETRALANASFRHKSHFLSVPENASLRKMRHFD